MREIAVLADNTRELPSALDRRVEILRRLHGRAVALFLDYDGTLAPIVEDPAAARLSPETRAAVARAARSFPVAVVSGRDLRDLRERVGVEGVVYAGSHGFEIAGPDGGLLHELGTEFLPELDAVERALRQRLSGVKGARIERKRFSLAVHYRQVDPAAVGAVGRSVGEALARHPRLRDAPGKKVHDLQPAFDWHKGRAVQWLLSALGLDRPGVVPIYLGDDLTDENAFRAIVDRGIGIVVRDADRASAARYALDGVDEVRAFLEWLVAARPAAAEAPAG